jgi:LuxR family transcriptional regulator, maltose regulon positive regulatory protein
MKKPHPNPDWVQAGKLSPPQQVVAVVRRRTLIERMQQHRDKRMVVVVAPPGFGKTTLLGQWWAGLRDDASCRAAWLSMDELDGDVGRFLAYLLLALERAGVPVDALWRLGSHGTREQSVDADVGRTVAMLVEAVRRAPTSVSLVLDDHHRGASAAVDDVLRRLIEAELPQLQLVIGARQRPRFPISALKARGLVHAIDAHDLVLSQVEAAEILGDHLSRSELAIVHARTEGWAVAVQLARIWMEQGQGSAQGLQTFGGRLADVADYLTEQLVDQLSPDLREFLLDTALLERFSPAMADAVRERRDSQALLARLADFEALLLPLDAQRSWFRYHALFAEYLQLRIEPERADRIHQRAAHWLAGQRDWSGAVRHALAGGDTALAAQLVRDAGGWELVLWRGMRYAQSIVEQFDDQTLRADPALLIMQAYLHARLGHEDLAVEMLRLAEWSLGHDERLQRDYRIIHALVLTIFDRFGAADRWPATVEEVEASIPRDDIGQGTLLCCSALAHFGEGRLDATVAIARLAAVRMQFASSPLGRNFCLMHEAMAHSTGGRVMQAGRLIDEALALAEQNFENQGSLKSMVLCFRAQHLYWRGDLALAARCADEVPHLLSHNDGWYDLYASAFEVHVRLRWREHGMTAVSPLLMQIANFARERRLPRLVQLTQAWRVDLLAQSGQLAQARLEAHAADLVALAQAARTPALHWRLSEAAVLALGRMHLCAGTPHLARGLIEPAVAAFAQRGLQLPAWRLQLLDLCTQKRTASEPEALPQFSALLAVLRAEGALGLVVEAGPGLLPWAARVDASAVGVAADVWTALLGKLQPAQDSVSAGRQGLNAKALDVLKLLSDGMPNKQIARVLAMSENTVKFHLKQIFAKLKVDNRLSAVTAAQKLGLLPRQDPH